MHKSWPDDYFNLEMMEPYFYISSCLKGKVAAAASQLLCL